MLTATVYDTHVEQLFDRIQQLHSMLTEAGIPYRIVGGRASPQMSMQRSIAGAFRT